MLPVDLAKARESPILALRGLIHFFLAAMVDIGEFFRAFSPTHRDVGQYHSTMKSRRQFYEPRDQVFSCLLLQQASRKPRKWSRAILSEKRQHGH